MSPKNETVLTRERILEAAEDVLRRYGPSKATVVDVARALGVSHGSVYKHFASKAELRDEVVRLWLTRVDIHLAASASVPGSAAERLRRWLDTLVLIKRSRACEDPELFAAYHELAGESRLVVQAHVDEMIRQIRSIIEDGAAAGEFQVDNPAIAALGFFESTLRFHHPAHSSEWSSPNIDQSLEAVWSLVIKGLS